MIAIVDYKTGKDIPLFLNDEDWYVTHKYNGNDTLTISINSDSEYYKYFVEEASVYTYGCRGGDNKYVVKNVDDHSNLLTIDCQIDLYDWRKTVYESYNRSSTNLDEVLQEITPSSWTYSGQEAFGDQFTLGSVNTGTSEEGNTADSGLVAVTPLQILDECSNQIGCVFNFDNINKRLKVVDPESFIASGDFLSDEVNLKSVGYVGNSDSIATRLYAYGKRDDNGENPVTIASVNGGLEYITNNEYTSNIICVGWSDERYSDPSSLLAAAKLQLESICKPTQSYELEANQLNRNIWLYMVLTLIDRKKRTRVDHQIIEWKEYGRKDLDVITLSATQPSIEGIFNDWDAGDITQDDLDNLDKNLTNAYTEAIKHATEMITGSYGGYFQQIYDASENWVELINLGDSMDINSAKKVWRWNKNGLGHSNNGYNGSYELALLADGSINANVITTGILQGGQSYWNLNTGDLSIIGRFRTRSDTNDMGIDINPNATLYYPNEGSTTDAAIIDFTGPFASNPSVRGNSGTSSKRRAVAEMFSGKRYSSDRCSYVYAMSSPDSTNSAPSDDGNASSYAESAMVTYQSYPSGGSPSSEKAAIFTGCYTYNDGHIDNYARLYVNNVAGGFAVGVAASAYYSKLYLNGLLSGYVGSQTFVMCWRNVSYSGNQSATYSYTLSSPAIVGSYKVFATINSNTPTVFGAFIFVQDTANSGWSYSVRSMPNYIEGRDSSSGSTQIYQYGVGSGVQIILQCLGVLA